MILAKIRVNGVRATPYDVRYIPMGIIGGQVLFEYTDPMWAGLTKTVVFQGTVTKDVVDAGELVTIPQEVVARAGATLRVGVYGTDSENNIAIPTIWSDTDLGRVRAAADPSGDESTDPQLPVWAQLQEQIKELKENGIGGGLTAEQITALDGMFKVCAFTKAEVSAEYNAFKTAFGIADSGEDSGGEEEPDTPVVTTCIISAELVNVTSNNSATRVDEGASYTAALTASDGYTLDGASVTVTMGGTDITSTAYADGVISIASVTGNVEIIVSAVQIEEVPAELNADGLAFNYDFRNATMEAYNLTGWGNVYRTVDETGNALIFGASAATGDDVGLSNYTFRENRNIANETAKIELGTAFTVQAHYKDAQPDLLKWGRVTTIADTIRFAPKYLDGTTETEISLDAITKRYAGYHTATYVVDGNILNIYFDGEIVHTLNGLDYDGFTKWVDYGVSNCTTNGGTVVSFVGYNRALSESEIVENIAYFKTMEVA